MNAIQFAGLFMVASAGIFASLQRHIGRIFGYATVAETGLLLLIIGLQTTQTVNLIFITLIPRGIELVIWALALSVLKQKVYSLQFSDLQGIGRKFPIATASLIIAHLSISGFPLLAGFPSRFSILGAVASESLVTTFWVFAGMIGLLIAAIRTLAVFVMTGEESKWELNESWVQISMLGLGVSGLFILGMFPQVLNPLLENLPSLFERLGQ
jgi:formate hydrogenlyase subunit 3/multisubunit Na+/H+ antiporter MnhD subunit